MVPSTLHITIFHPCSPIAEHRFRRKRISFFVCLLSAETIVQDASEIIEGVKSPELDFAPVVKKCQTYVLTYNSGYNMRKNVR